MRVVGANIPYEWFIYLLMLIPLSFFFYGCCHRIKVWTRGRGDINRRDFTWKRILSLLVNALGQRQLIRKPLAGWMHFLLFWGFVFLFLATVAFAMWDKTGFPPLTGSIYIAFSWAADATGFLAMLAVLMLAVIRYIQHPDRLNDSRPLDGWILLLIFLVLLGGFIIEGLRLAVQIRLSPTLAQIAYEKTASPVGWIFSSLFSGLTFDTIILWHRIAWWSHMALAFLFIGALPFTKLWHIFTGMFNYYVRDLGPSANRMVENIEEAEMFGVESIEGFTWKDLLDLDACIRCGRCQENCPTYMTGKALNPKITLIQALKKHMDRKTPFFSKR